MIKHSYIKLLVKWAFEPPSTSLGINRINPDSSCPDLRGPSGNHGADKDGVSDIDMFIIFYMILANSSPLISNCSKLYKLCMILRGNSLDIAGRDFQCNPKSSTHHPSAERRCFSGAQLGCPQVQRSDSERDLFI
jgi:hypothetical protein